MNMSTIVFTAAACSVLSQRRPRPAAEADGMPREFVDFCRVLDGASCGPNVQLFGLEEAEEQTQLLPWAPPSP
jgi:hypothetical protein